MKSIPSRLPSPALVISCVALFASLGGVSYGLVTASVDSREIKNNTIRSKDVRNNTLRTFDIRNNEVRGFDIRNSSVQGRDVAFDTLTGDDVSEQTLAKVPSAATADRAAIAATADSAAIAGIAGSAGTVNVLKTIAPITVAEGAPAATLATHGPLTLSGACEESGGDTVARLRLQTTESGSAGGGITDDPVIDPADGPVVVAVVSDPSPGALRTVQDSSVFAFAPSGKAFTGLLGLHADAAGAGSCLFYGHVALEG